MKAITRSFRSLSKWAEQSDARALLNMVFLIALIHFVIEAVIMASLSRFNFTRQVVLEGLLDCTTLTVFATPAVYFWIVKPFADASRCAREALVTELSLRRQQTAELRVALDELKKLLTQNEDLRRRLQEASANSAEINERALQRIGGDLHDGPAQLLAYSLLRLQKLAPAANGNEPATKMRAFSQMRLAISEALTEVRNISMGLSLPELQRAELDEVVCLAISQHKDRTGSHVDVAMGPLPKQTSQALKVCAYRLVQEGLANAYRHAGGKGQRVEVQANGDVQIVVSDEGGGFPPEANPSRGLGLSAMRARVEALGGSLDIRSVAGCGVRLSARFDLNKVPNPPADEAF